MGALDTLHAGLQPTPVWSDDSNWDKEPNRQIAVLTKRVRETVTLRPSSDLVVQAHDRFATTGQLATSRDARILSMTCTEKVGEERRIIEDLRLFRLLLKGVDQFQPHRDVFRNCYQGLLAAYLHYHPQDAENDGPKSWNELRTWLRERDTLLLSEAEEVAEEWVSELERNRNIFSEDPAAYYGAQILNGQSSAFAQFRRALAIEDSAWLIKQLVLGAVRATVKKPDTEFKHHLPQLFELLAPPQQPKSSLFNEGLAQLLIRFSKCASDDEHQDLSTFARAHWGMPPEEDQKRGLGDWVTVPPEVRRMAFAWFSLHAIERFFRVLSKDGTSDVRRLRFWAKYHTKLKKVRFALGPQVRYSRDQDTKTVLHDFKHLLVDLVAGGDSGNNAFIMVFDGWVAVEYGVTGNACFIFKDSDMPFVLGQDVSAPEVRAHEKRSASADRKLHIDRSAQKWEGNFEDALSARGIHAVADNGRRNPYTGRISESSTAARRPAASTDVQSRVVPTRSTPSIAARAETKPTQSQFDARAESQLREECRRHRYLIRDLRLDNGNLWVEVDDSDNNGLSERLAAWGFRYKPGKGWWISNENN
jgi:hypothetical protein